MKKHLNQLERSLRKKKDKIRNLFSSDTFKPLLNRSQTTDKLLDIGNKSTLDDDLEKSLEMLKNLTISVEKNKRKPSKKLENEIKKKSKNDVCLFSDM